LIDYIGELHPFYVNVVKTLPFQDALGVTEAVAHVLAVIPVAGLTSALQSFCMPLAQDLHTIIVKGKDAVPKEERIRAGGKEELVPERERVMLMPLLSRHS
jgi:transportin-3